MDEDTGVAEEQGAQEEIQEEAAAEENPVLDELRSLKAEIAALKASGNGATTTAKSDEDYLDDDMAKRIAQDPKLAAQWIKRQAEKAKRDVESTAQKNLWDAETVRKYPAIQTDKRFQGLVQQKVNELVASGEYANNSPRLVFRAAQLAALEHKFSSVSEGKQTKATSVDGARPAAGMRSQVNGGQQPKAQIADNDPRVVVARAMGIRGEKMKKFKEHLRGYGEREVPEQRKTVRRFEVRD